MNLIWIISDTLRIKDVGFYGNKKIQTPAMDALGAKSVAFNRHYIASFPTMPTRADFFTGRWTGTFLEWGPLPPEQDTLPNIITQNGYATAAVVDTPFYLHQNIQPIRLNDCMNYEFGFNSFIEIPGQGSPYFTLGGKGHGKWRSEAERFAPRTFTAAGEWLENHYRDKFFLYVDTWDPHEPYDAPDYYTELYWPGYDGEVIEPTYKRWQDSPGFTEEKVKKAYATYWGEITMVDTWLGYFLKKVENMGLMKNTAIIFTTDHGFYFGEHGGIFGKEVMGTGVSLEERHDVRWKGSPMYEELNHIPLFIYLPGVRPGTTEGLTSAIDLMPTVLDILGMKAPDWVEGHSLLPMVKNKKLKGREYVVSGHPLTGKPDKNGVVPGRIPYALPGWDTTITTQEWALLYSLKDPCELYHLPSDPDQHKNVIKKYPEVAKKLHAHFIDFLRETKTGEELVKPRLVLNY
jgi:arylsulfatase A-like enzyme